MSSSHLGKAERVFRYLILLPSLRTSVSEVLDESLIIEVGPIVALNLLVEGLELLLDLILSCGNHELFLSRADIGSVKDEEDLGFDSAVTGGVFDFEDSISILIYYQHLQVSIGVFLSFKECIAIKVKDITCTGP